jgi:hypothetical protein
MPWRKSPRDRPRVTRTGDAEWRLPLRRGEIHDNADRGICFGTALHLFDLPDAWRGRSNVDAGRIPDH